MKLGLPYNKFTWESKVDEIAVMAMTKVGHSVEDKNDFFLIFISMKTYMMRNNENSKNMFNIH